MARGERVYISRERKGKGLGGSLNGKGYDKEKGKKNKTKMGTKCHEPRSRLIRIFQKRGIFFETAIDISLGQGLCEHLK